MNGRVIHAIAIGGDLIVKIRKPSAKKICGAGLTSGRFKACNDGQSAMAWAVVMSAWLELSGSLKVSTSNGFSVTLFNVPTPQLPHCIGAKT